MSDTTYAQAAPNTAFENWQLYESARTRRIFAFVLDYVLVFLLVVLAVPVVALLGVATFGLGWLLYAILGPLVALIYVGWTMGSPRQATLGMRAMDLMLVRYDGQRLDTITAVVHAVLFWASCSVLTPFILLVGLFTQHKRLLHDLALGTVAVRASRFASAD